MSHEDGGVCARLDRAGQAQAQTIEQQLERLRAQVRAQGEELASEAIFRDDGISGATLNRPGLDRLRDAVRAGSVERVLVTDPDRLARNDSGRVDSIKASLQRHRIQRPET